MVKGNAVIIMGSKCEIKDCKNDICMFGLCKQHAKEEGRRLHPTIFGDTS